MTSSIIDFTDWAEALQPNDTPFSRAWTNGPTYFPIRGESTLTMAINNERPELRAEEVGLILQQARVLLHEISLHIEDIGNDTDGLFKMEVNPECANAPEVDFSAATRTQRDRANRVLNALRGVIN